MDSYERWKRNISGAVEGPDIFATGVGGVLYPPQSLHLDVLREDLFMALCPLEMTFGSIGWRSVKEAWSAM
jgi:hypothetical protein